jgi:serine/threonine protein kinase
MEDDPMLQEQTVINECYILQSMLGEDSFTEHWSATAIFSAKKFLLRFLKADIDSAMSEKVRDASMRSYRAQGSSIADIVEFEEWQGRAFISSEFRDELNLAERNRSPNGFNVEDACAVLLSLARGLSVFHGQALTYGNLNPEQVLIGKSGPLSASVRIQKPSMFPLIGLIPHGDARAETNFAYASPACKNGAVPTAADDVYSLGVHLVRLFVGRLPFPDDETRLREGEPSLRFAANAFLRRGIPTALARMALRALMGGSPERYRSCSEFVTDLRAFMESNKIGTGLREDYFRTESRGRGGDSSTVYPVAPLDAGAVDRIERAELLAGNDATLRSVDDYIRSGLRTIAADGSESCFGVKPRAMEVVQPPQPPHVQQPPQPPQPLQPPHVQPTQPQQSPRQAPAQPPKPDIKPTPQTASTRSRSVTAAIAKVPPKKRSRKKASASARNMVPSRYTDRVSWNYHRIQYDDVIKIIGISVARAKKGSGSFRFIQEPPDAAMGSRLFHELERLSSGATYVNIGSCSQYGIADVKDFLSMTRAALARVLSTRAPSARSALSGKLRPLDEYGAFSAAPTGKLLYGKDGPEIDETVLDTESCQQAVIRALFAFGKKDRPLVITVRHGECATRELDAFLNRLALGMSGFPACVIVFFSDGSIESWHSLSAIARAKFENGGGMNDS